MPEIELTLAKATAVIEMARKPREVLDNEPVYSGVLPDDDGRRIQIATELVGFAVDAYLNDDMRGEETTELLDAAGVTITDEGEILADGAAFQGDNGSAPEPQSASAEPEKVVLIGPDGAEGEYPAAAVEALLAAGFKEPQTADANEPAQSDEPADDEMVIVDISGVKAEMPYGSAKNLIATGAGELVQYDLGPEPPAESDAGAAADGDDPYAGQELEEPWPKYNETSDVDIRRQMEEMTDEEIKYVKAYEERHKNRQRIGKFQRKGPEPDRSAQSAGEGPAADAHADLDAQADDAAARDDDPVGALEGGGTPPSSESHMPILTAHEERQLALAEVEKSHLPVPPDKIEHPPDFPEDVAAISDGELATLHSQYNACLALAIWKHGLVQVDERAFKYIADFHARDARKGLDQNNPATGKPKGRELLDREAEDDETVQAWREKQYNAEVRAIPLRRLIDIYSGHVEVLSRQWTFREREHDSSGGLAKRS